MLDDYGEDSHSNAIDLQMPRTRNVFWSAGNHTPELGLAFSSSDLSMLIPRGFAFELPRPEAGVAGCTINGLLQATRGVPTCSVLTDQVR